MDGAGDKVENGTAGVDAIKFATAVTGDGYIRLVVHFRTVSITCFAADVALGAGPPTTRLGYGVWCSLQGQVLDTMGTYHHRSGLADVAHVEGALSCANADRLTIQVTHLSGAGSAYAYVSNIRLGTRTGADAAASEGPQCSRSTVDRCADSAGRPVAAVSRCYDGGGCAMVVTTTDRSRWRGKVP